MRIAASVVFLLVSVAMALAQDNPPPAPDPADQPPPPPPAQLAPVEPIKYFIAADGKTTGPFSIEEIKAKIADGTVKGLTMMWKKGMAGWEPAEKLAEVKLALDETPKPAPFDCVAFAVGAWQKTTLFNGQTVTIVTQFDQGGQFISVQTLQGLPGSSSYGTWTSTAVGERACSFTLNVQYPTAGSGTAVYEIENQSTIIDKSDGSRIVRLQ